MQHGQRGQPRDGHGQSRASNPERPFTGCNNGLRGRGGYGLFWRAAGENLVDQDARLGNGLQARLQAAVEAALEQLAHGAGRNGFQIDRRPQDVSEDVGD